jgi:hypothetical protein
MTLHPEFKEFAVSLNENEVRYMVVGGYAVAFHGHPRYTKDLDVWIEREPGNVARLLSALREFGFGSLGLSADDFLEPDQIIQLGFPPNRINLLTDLEGVDFGQANAGIVAANVDGIPIYFIGLEDLKRNKRAVGRHQDLADLERLE